MQFKLSLMLLLLIATLVTTCLADKVHENASENLKDDDGETVDSKVCASSFQCVFNADHPFILSIFNFRLWSATCKTKSA